MHDQEAAVQQTFHLERSSFFYLLIPMVRTQCSAYYPILHTAALNDFCPSEVKPRPMKPSIDLMLDSVPSIQILSFSSQLYSSSVCEFSASRRHATKLLTSSEL